CLWRLAHGKNWPLSHSFVKFGNIRVPSSHARTESYSGSNNRCGQFSWQNHAAPPLVTHTGTHSVTLHFRTPSDGAQFDCEQSGSDIPGTIHVDAFVFRRKYLLG